MGADRVVHFVLTEVQIALDVRKKGPGLINTPVSFFLRAVLYRAGLLNTLLAQASAGGRALASLELRVALADDVEGTLTLHDLTISVTALHGGE